MKAYQNPNVEIIDINATDVIRTSNPPIIELPEQDL